LAGYEATISKSIGVIIHPIITIFCPFTRTWAVETWLDNLKNVQHDPALTNLCIIVDGNLHLIANTLKKFAEANNYRSFHVKINEDWHVNEVRLSIRRQRVAEIHNQSKDLIARTDGDIIIGLEDDTVFDRLTSFERLYQPLLDDPTIGFVEGAEMGRWGANMIGAWEADDIHNPKEVKTLLPGTGYQEITAGGFYGYATRRHLYMNCEYYSSSAQPWGPDFNAGIWIRQQGYSCLVDWDTIFGHNDYNKVLYHDDPTIRLEQVIFNKNIINGKWDRSDFEQDRY